MTHYPCRLRNATSRPVEVHRDGEVLVLLPGEFLEVDDAEPGLETLERSGVLTRHELPPPPKARKPRAKPAPAPKGAKSAAKSAKAAKTTPAPKSSKATPAKAKAAPAAAKPAAETAKTAPKGAKTGSTPKRPSAADSGELP